MTAEGFPETAEEIRAVSRTTEFKGELLILSAIVGKMLLIEEMPYEEHLAHARARLEQKYGPRLTEGMFEWVEAQSSCAPAGEKVE